MCSNWRKANTKEKPWKKPEEKSTSPIEEQKMKTRSYLSLETMQERRKRREILKVLQQNKTKQKHQPRILTKLNSLQKTWFFKQTKN